MYLGLNLDTGELLAVKAVPIALDEDDEVGVGVLPRCMADGCARSKRHLLSVRSH